MNRRIFLKGTGLVTAGVITSPELLIAQTPLPFNTALINQVHNNLTNMIYRFSLGNMVRNDMLIALNSVTTFREEIQRTGMDVIFKQAVPYVPYTDASFSEANVVNMIWTQIRTVNPNYPISNVVAVCNLSPQNNPALPLATKQAFVQGALGRMRQQGLAIALEDLEGELNELWSGFDPGGWGAQKCSWIADEGWFLQAVSVTLGWLCRFKALTLEFCVAAGLFLLIISTLTFISRTGCV